MKRKNWILSGAVVGILVLGAAGGAFAGTTYESFSTTVGKLNGSGYTGSQTKARGGQFGRVNTTSVGGGKVVDARIQKSDGSSSGAWAKDMWSGSSRDLPNSIPAGSRTRVQFSNDIGTVVDVQVSGTWRSN